MFAGIAASKPMIAEQEENFLIIHLHPHAVATGRYQNNAIHQHSSPRGNDIWPALSKSAHRWLWITSMSVPYATGGKEKQLPQLLKEESLQQHSKPNFTVILTLHKSRWQLVHPLRPTGTENPFKSKPEPVMYFSADWNFLSTLECKCTTTLRNVQAFLSQVYSNG